MLAITAQKIARFIMAARRIQARKIGLEPVSDSVVIRDSVEDHCSVNDPVQSGNQHGNESRQRTQKERGRCCL
jgi:hypothetical protein